MDKFKMIIYDCDGVIFNSKRANFEYYSYIFNYFNLKIIEPENKKHLEVLHTYSNDEVFKYFIKDKNLLKKIIDFSKTIDYSIFYKYMKLEPDFFKSCKILKNNNFKIGVATNRSISFKGIVKFFNLDKVIDNYVTALDVSRPKPYPDMLNLILRKNNLKAFEALFVGDSIIDYKASTLANIKFIGYKIRIENEIFINNHMDILNFLNLI